MNKIGKDKSGMLKTNLFFGCCSGGGISEEDDY